MDNTVADIILNRLSKLEEKLDHVENRVVEVDRKIAYFAGFFTALGAVISLASQKIYHIMFG